MANVLEPLGYGCQDRVLYSGAVQRSVVALVLVAVVLVVFAPIVLGGKTWDDVPYHTEVAPARIAAADAVLGGALPTWWDGTGLGVPLLGEPSHGAAYPLTWLSATPGSLDLVLVLHVLWCAIGVALWARRLRASELGALVAGVLVATAGVIASAALRGALPALAQLPWIAVAGSHCAWTQSPAARARSAVALGVLLGLVGLAGQLAVLVHALVLAALVLARRWRWLVVACAIGLAIASVQWLPALFVLGDTAGATVHPLALSRLVELVLPLPQLGAAVGADEAAWFPSLFVGAPLFALAAISEPRRRFSIFAGVLAVLALVVGRGGSWPHWLGIPELHVVTLAIIAAAHAGVGFDAVLAGERRAILALAGAAVALAVAFSSVLVLRSRVDAEHLGAIDRALVSGGLALACAVGVLALAWRIARVGGSSTGSAEPSRARGHDRANTLRTLAVTALVVAPSVGAVPVVAPTTERALVATPPAWVEKAIAPTEVTLDGDHAHAAARGPLRVFRPIMSFGGPNPVSDVRTLEAAIATLAGTSAAKWGIGAARSDDPARPEVHDRVWLAAAGAGGQLLDRYDIALAILPGSMVGGRGLTEVARRGNLGLVRYPASPSAALVYEWIFVDDVETALARLFPPGAGRGLGAGLVVLQGTGRENQDEPGPAQPCTIDRWSVGAIDLSCDARGPAYAVVSSTAARGWTVSVDGADVPWLAADVMRRAVAVTAGEHRIAWRYRAPGLRIAFVLAALAVAALVAVLLVYGRDPDDRDEPPDPERPDLN